LLRYGNLKRNLSNY